jgi:hypothetical protein
METAGRQTLHELLFGGGRELLNIKFMAGTARGLTVDNVGAETASVLASALQRSDADEPPMSGSTKKSITDVLAAN